MKFTLKIVLEKTNPSFDINNKILLTSIDDSKVEGYDLNNYKCIYSDISEEGGLIDSTINYFMYNTQADITTKILDVQTLKLIETTLPKERVIFPCAMFCYISDYFFVGSNINNKLLKVKKSDFSVVDTFENIVPTLYGKYIFVDDTRYLFLSREDITCFRLEDHKVLWSRKLKNIAGKKIVKPIENIFVKNGHIFLDINIKETNVDLFILDVENGKVKFVFNNFAHWDKFYIVNNILYKATYNALHAINVNTLEYVIYDFSTVLELDKVDIGSAVAISDDGLLYFANANWSKHIYMVNIHTKNCKLVIKMPTQKNYGIMDMRLVDNKLLVRGSNRSLYVFEIED